MERCEILKLAVMAGAARGRTGRGAGREFHREAKRNRDYPRSAPLRHEQGNGLSPGHRAIVWLESDSIQLA